MFDYFSILSLGNTEKELLISIFPLSDVEAYETGKERDDLVARDGRTANELIECETLALQAIDELVNGVGIGYHRALRVL